MKTCDNCIIDGTDACTRGAGRAVNDNICENFLEESEEWKINKEDYTWNLILALANCVLTDDQKREILKMAEKIKSDDQIVIGDICKYSDGSGLILVTCIYVEGDKKFFDGVNLERWDFFRVIYDGTLSLLKKTGRHINLNKLAIILEKAEKQSTNKDKLIDLPSEDLYDKMVWLFHDYGKRFTDSRSAIN